jgi:hypothetical protein
MAHFYILCKFVLVSHRKTIQVKAQLLGQVVRRGWDIASPWAQVEKIK